MSVNEANLTNRLIQAERELTALKTAHNRGLGVIKLYHQIVNVQKQQTSSVFFGDVNFTIQIDRASEPFPLLKVYQEHNDSGTVWGIIVNRIKLSSDGYTIYVSADAVFPSAPYSLRAKVVSTSDIDNITYTITGG